MNNGENEDKIIFFGKMGPKFNPIYKFKPIYWTRPAYWTKNESNSTLVTCTGTTAILTRLKMFSRTR